LPFLELFCYLGFGGYHLAMLSAKAIGAWSLKFVFCLIFKQKKEAS